MSQFLNLQEIDRPTMAWVQTERTVQLDETLCNGCRLCLPACNFKALIWIRSDDELMIDHWACNGCGKCVSLCPTEALSLHPRKLG